MPDTIILCIETATEVCSVALSKSGVCIAEKSIKEPNVHGTLLTVLIVDILKENHLSFSDLSAVAYSDGPGSYTGLRIGLSVAKGICFGTKNTNEFKGVPGANIPLIAISTLQHIAANPTKKDCFYFPMLDARRMEVYGALLNKENNFIQEPFSCIVDTYNWEELLSDKKVCFLGNGVAKSKEILNAFPNAMFEEGYTISASSICGLADKKFKEKQFADLAYHVPFYLKEANVSVSKKKAL